MTPARSLRQSERNYRSVNMLRKADLHSRASSNAGLQRDQFNSQLVLPELDNRKHPMLGAAATAEASGLSSVRQSEGGSPVRGIAGLKALSNMPIAKYLEVKDQQMMPGPSQMSV